MSWRNPTKKQKDWGLNSYVEALDRASDVAREIAKSDNLNVVAACSGGITAAMFLADWITRGDETTVASVTCLVTVLEVEGGGLSGEEGWTIDGHKLSLSDVKYDTFIVGGETANISHRGGCYLSHHAFGGDSQFDLPQAGQIQSLINPLGNPRAKFMTNDGNHKSPEEFLVDAKQHSGKEQAAPKSYGSHKYKPLDDASGAYVHP